MSRNDEIVEMRKSGKTYAEIGKKYGITGSRARQIYERHERKRRKQERVLESMMSDLPITLCFILFRAGIENKQELIDLVKSDRGVRIRQCGEEYTKLLSDWIGFSIKRDAYGYFKEV